MNAKLLLGALAFMLFGKQTYKRKKKRISFKKRYYNLLRRRRWKNRIRNFGRAYGYIRYGRRMSRRQRNKFYYNRYRYSGRYRF